MRVEVNEESVIEANSQFWEQMLAMTVDPLPIAGEFCVGAGHVLGSVDLSGVWNGRIEVRLAKGLAYHATAAMLMQPVNSVVTADALDAVKEIANMVAGGIKSSLPRPCAMAVPESGVAAERFCGTVRSEHSLVVAFRHAAGDLMVRVLEKACPQ